MNMTPEKALSQPLGIYTFLLYFIVYASVALVFFMEKWFSISDNIFITIIAIAFVAGRQHSLYVLNHDAVHGSLFKSKHWNRWVATIFSVFPMLHHPELWSFIRWKRDHIHHHAFLFTEHDPNYQFRFRHKDTLHSITPWRLVTKCLISAPMSVFNFFKQLLSVFIPAWHDPELKNEWISAWVFILIACGLITYFELWRSVFIFWIIPMYTIYPMILTYFDLTEHFWEAKETSPASNTRSVTHGFLLKTLISHLPRGLHREHHLYPGIPAANLPFLKMMLDKRQCEHCNDGQP